MSLYQIFVQKNIGEFSVPKYWTLILLTKTILWTKIFVPVISKRQSYIISKSIKGFAPHFKMKVINHIETCNGHQPSFRKDNHISFQRDNYIFWTFIISKIKLSVITKWGDLFCQDIVHPLVFWCNLVLIFSFNFPIAPWQKVSGCARSSV